MITLRAAQRHDRQDHVLEPARRPELRVVDDVVEPSRRTPAGVVGTLLVGLLFVCIFGIVVFQVFLVQTQAHLDDLSQKVSAQESTAKQLRLDTADLESPSRIEKDAKDRLGMVPPNDIGYLQAKADDDAKAAFDPTREKMPTTTVPAPPPTPSAGASSGGTSAAGKTTSSTSPSKTTSATATTVKPSTAKPSTSAPKTPATSAPKTTTTTSSPAAKTTPTTQSAASGKR